jgi:hypothetical protein
MVRISRVRRHKAHADPDIVPYLKSLRPSDCRVGVAVQELLVLCISASPDLPVELRLDDGEGIGQRADRACLTARVLQRPRQMAADRQPGCFQPSGLGGSCSAENIRPAAVPTRPSTLGPWRIAASAKVRKSWRSGARSDVICGILILRMTSWHKNACS